MNTIRCHVLAITLGSVSFLDGCSAVGPGLANHPMDCAIGIKWADCLPGTPGYNNGGSLQTRAQQVQREFAAIKSELQAGQARFESEMQNPELDPIRHKVELLRPILGAPPPFEISSNDSFPTDAERPVIAKWAKLRDEYIKRVLDIRKPPPSETALQASFDQRDWAFNDEAAARGGELIVALYQGKLTYGELAQKRYELSRDAVAAERQFREAALLADQQRQKDASQLAAQEFQNKIMVWSTYMQTVNARQPQTVHLDGSVRLNSNCTSTRLGNSVNTDCY